MEIAMISKNLHRQAWTPLLLNTMLKLYKNQITKVYTEKGFPIIRFSKSVHVQWFNSILKSYQQIGFNILHSYHNN